MSIKCEICGSINIVKRDGVFVCQNCGVSYSLENIRKMNSDCNSSAAIHSTYIHQENTPPKNPVRFDLKQEPAEQCFSPKKNFSLITSLVLVVVAGASIFGISQLSRIHSETKSVDTKINSLQTDKEVSETVSDNEKSTDTTVTTTTAPVKTTTTTTTTTAITTTPEAVKTTTAVSKTKSASTTAAKLISVPFEPTKKYNHPIRTMQVDIRDDRMHWRIGPGKKYERVNEGGVARGEILDIYGEEVDENGDRWGYVKRADKFGWIMEKYLVDYDPYNTKYKMITRPQVYCDDPYEFTVLVNGLRLRTSPSTSGEVMCEISKGTRLAELGYNPSDSGKWVYTQYKGQTGWVMAYNGYGHDDPKYELYVRFDSGMGKPVIYLYPTEKTDVSVKLELLTSDMSVTYPNYGNGWNVTAYPDGRIVNKADGGNYDYLFWESVNSNTHYDMSEGFCVSAEDTESFLREKLEILGLTERERNEFIVYWLPIMKENKYNYVTFQTTCYTDAARLNITPKPDTLIRVYMAFVGLDEPKDTHEPALTTPKRRGFTAVEWGGCEIK